MKKGFPSVLASTNSARGLALFWRAFEGVGSQLLEHRETERSKDGYARPHLHLYESNQASTARDGRFCHLVIAIGANDTEMVIFRGCHQESQGEE